MKNIRIEKDSLGELEIPAEALYGVQTQRAIDNFPISGKTLPKDFIYALIQLKKHAALVNVELSCIDQSVGEAIVKACEKLLADDNLMQHFPVDVFQTGSGTSSNMNANEVIARLAFVETGILVNPNDHVNYGQSSNDVIPSAIHISSSIVLENQLLPALKHLKSIIDKRALELADTCKTGRTHLMDAMPVTMGQSLSAWSSQINQQIILLKDIQPIVQTLALGGTAVGTGINAHPEFAALFNLELSKTLGIQFTKADNFFALISSQDTTVNLSGICKSTAVSLMKVANDLRWMNSGPLAGLGEIELPALQPGSSIMPGKVNPVIPEAMAMVAAQVIGNDSAITIGGQSGNFELNVMLPMIAANLLDSMQLLSNSSRLLADKAIAGFVVNQTNLNQALSKNPILVTALNPIIGYQKAAEIAKQAYKEHRPVIDVAKENTDLTEQQLIELLNPHSLTQGG